MEGRKATTAIFIDRYHPKTGGLCAVSIRVTHDRKKKYYPTPVCLTVSDFEKVQGPKPRNEFKELALKLQAYESKAAKIINSLPVFTWKAFEKYYLTNRAAKDSWTWPLRNMRKNFGARGGLEPPYPTNVPRAASINLLPMPGLRMSVRIFCTGMKNGCWSWGTV